MANNFAEAFLQGQAIGTQQRKDREASHLERLMGEAYTADPANRDAALQQVGLRSPRAAMELEGAFGQQEDRRRSGLQNRARLMLSVPVNMRPQLWQRMRTDIAQAYPDLAEAASMDYDPATFDPVLQQLASDKSGGTPAQVQVFEAQARAAGLQPGSPEYQKAAQIALGLQGRASSAGMSFDTVDDNGIPRPQRRDPRSGQVELYVAEQGAWVPLGGGQSAPQAQPMPQGTPQPSGNGDPKADSIMTAANAMVRAGVPQPQVEAFIQQSMAAAGLNPQPGGQEPPQMVPAGGGQAAPAAPTLDRVPINSYGGGAINPTLGRGRTKEEEAAAVEAAKLRTNLQFAPEQAEADANREAMVTGARETAEAAAKRQAALPQIITKSDQTLALINQALNHRGRLTATGASGRFDPRNYAPGTDAMDFQVLLDQLKGQTFLEAFQSLKGGGAITQVEGQKAEQAIARLNTAQSDEAFEKALKELAEVAESAKRRAIEAAGGEGLQGSGEVPADDEALIGKYL